MGEKEYSYIVMAFQAAYALGLLFVGPFIDKVGSSLDMQHLLLSGDFLDEPCTSKNSDRIWFCPFWIGDWGVG